MSSMTRLTMIAGVILILVGIGGYFGTGRVSLTALIPSGFGLIILLLGVAARKEHIRKHAMHGAVGLALLGILGSVGGVRHLVSGHIETRYVLQAVMFLVCCIYAILGGQSFVNARIARRQGSSK
jgi:hypothetical protein